MVVTLSGVYQSARLVGDVVANAFDVVKGSVLGTPQPTAAAEAPRSTTSYLQHVPFVGPIDQPTQAVVDVTRAVMAMTLSGVYQSTRLVGYVVANTFDVVRGSVLGTPQPTAAAEAPRSTTSYLQHVPFVGPINQPTQAVADVVALIALSCLISLIICLGSAKYFGSSRVLAIRPTTWVAASISVCLLVVAYVVGSGTHTLLKQRHIAPHAAFIGIGAIVLSAAYVRVFVWCTPDARLRAGQGAVPQRNQVPEDPPLRAARPPHGVGHRDPRAAHPQAVPNNQAIPQRNQVPEDPPLRAARPPHGVDPPADGIGVYHFECPNCKHTFPSFCRGLNQGSAPCYRCKHANVPPKFKLPRNNIRRTSNNTHNCNECLGVGRCPVMDDVAVMDGVGRLNLD